MSRRSVSCTLAFLLAAFANPASAQEDSVAVARADSAQARADSAMIEADTLRDEHPQDSPDQTGFLFETPDRKGQLRIRASIRLNGAYDFNGLQSTDVFDTYEIPVGATTTEPARSFPRRRSPESDSSWREKHPAGRCLAESKLISGGRVTRSACDTLTAATDASWPVRPGPRSATWMLYR